MNRQRIKDQLALFSLSMFRKDFFGIYHGGISAKTDSNSFLINKKEAIFDSLESQNLIELYYNKDYRWNEASIDADIHLLIYKNITDAKYITFSMPPYTTAFSLSHSAITPKDYFGHKELGHIDIYDPKEFITWYDRAPTEISHYFQNSPNNIMVIKGYGVYAYNRDIHAMARDLAILEKSCRILMLDAK